ncbi:MAG: hypothetical protein NBV65_08005 [Burkholderiaceae bacterium]|nr:hypothetical protein [Burkholderiaceae bacterium]
MAALPALPDQFTLALHAVLLLLLAAGLLALRRWPRLYAISLWPGTVAHELLHYVAGLIFGAQPLSLSVIPRRKPDGGWLLGSVSFARLRWWNSVPVGLAPLALVPAGGWIFIESASLPLLSLPALGMKLAATQCLVAGWPSPRDWAHAIVGLLMLAALAMAVGMGAGALGISFGRLDQAGSTAVRNEWSRPAQLQRGASAAGLQTAPITASDNSWLAFCALPDSGNVQTTSSSFSRNCCRNMTIPESHAST